MQKAKQQTNDNHSSKRERERERERHTYVQLLKLLLRQIRERSDSVDRRGVQHLMRSGDLFLRPLHWSSQGKKRVIHAKRAAFKAAVMSKKILHSIGKATWIAGTTFLILTVPLIIEMDRDQQLTEIEL